MFLLLLLLLIPSCVPHKRIVTLQRNDEIYKVHWEHSHAADQKTLANTPPN